jgi:hypothetical protein
MRLFLFGASVFYLLGLRLSSQIEIKSSLNTKPELKHRVQPLELKPEPIKNDSLVLPATKRVQPATSSAKSTKKDNLR